MAGPTRRFSSAWCRHWETSCGWGEERIQDRSWIQGTHKKQLVEMKIERGESKHWHTCLNISQKKRRRSDVCKRLIFSTHLAKSLRKSSRIWVTSSTMIRIMWSFCKNTMFVLCQLLGRSSCLLHMWKTSATLSEDKVVDERKVWLVVNTVLRHEERVISRCMTKKER